MSLLNDLKSKVLDVLVKGGWGPLFQQHGIDIAMPLDRLEAELDNVALIDRTIPGFADFAFAGMRAVEPGHPGLSLLYHALASPNVIPEIVNANSYPTIEQLDIVENYIYSRARARLAQFKDPVIAVFAYHYRDKERTHHRQHADLSFSRTGISRVGNEPSLYDPMLRGFDPRPGKKSQYGFRTLPARYAAFIAERRPQAPNGTVMRGVSIDAGLTFLFPVHKLFAGDECLLAANGDPLRIPKLEFVERHITEKLAKIHLSQDGQNPGFVKPLTKPKFDLRLPPFVRDSTTDPKLISIQSIGASILLNPVPGALVRTEVQSVRDTDELVRFKVPPLATIGTRRNRYWSTLELPAQGDSRAAPEYANIRQEVVMEGKTTKIVDLNKARNAEFNQKWEHGGYEAAHFVDNTCEGAIVIKPVRALDIPVFCAYSLVTALDYFPLVDQLEVEEWIEKRQGRPIGLAEPERQFPQGGPQPMSDGRFDWERATGQLVATRQVPNVTLPHPVNATDSAFSLTDPSVYTATAIVGKTASGGCLAAIVPNKRATSWLPDGASDVFAPGWDVSQHRLGSNNMYAAYGLGSPFPEDAKLCAALNSFWPAVAPDSARTYGFRPPAPFNRGRGLRTSLPLSDLELGYHQAHPRVQAGEVKESRGWDGDYGPCLVYNADARFVDASNPLRADQTRAALDGIIGFCGLDKVDTNNFIERLEVLNWCRSNLMEVFDVENAWLVSFEYVDDWAAWKSKVLARADATLTGRGVILVFCLVGPGVDEGDPPFRRRFPVRDSLEVQMANIEDFTRFDAIFREELKPLVFVRRNDEPFAKQGA